MVNLDDGKEKQNGGSFDNNEKFLNKEEYKVQVLNKDNELVELNNVKNSNKREYKRLLTTDYEEMYKNTPITDDTSCGYGFLRNSFLQKFANKKAYVFLYGVSGCIFSATYAYFNSTITTLEKRYKIPSKTVGFIGVGNDISSLFVSAALSYYAGKSHRPRWIAFGTLLIALFCFLSSLPHFLYGSGEEALSLTLEHGGIYDYETTQEILEREKLKKLCQTDNTTISTCEVIKGSNFAPQVILFVAQLIAGVGSTLYYTLGASYMDDNIQKAKTPALISISYFLRTLGPAIGYTLGSYCLKIYIAPDLTPTVTNADPRWLGAWWMGWIIIGGGLVFFAFFLSLFPRELPRAAVRRKIKEERLRRGEITEDVKKTEDKASFKDMIKTFKRIALNKCYMCNTFSSVFYYFGYMPYWIFTPKYIETQYKQSASTASLVTGTVALAFSAIGILASGLIISKYKPRARYLAAWNVFVGLASVLGTIVYVFLGCAANEGSLVVNQPEPGQISCNSNCNCDYVKYSPVCGNNGMTYISPCHAGCTNETEIDGVKTYVGCSCIVPNSIERLLDQPTYSLTKDLVNETPVGSAVPNACIIDCYTEFIMFLGVMCIMKFIGATGRASNFLVSVRCVDEKDKTASMGFGMMIVCLLAFMPSPIFFGALLDSTCILWGKTCGGKGNCWLYDNYKLRIWLNTISCAFLTVGTLLDAGVWYYVKNLKIFDDDLPDFAIEEVKKEEEKENVKG